MSVNAPEVKLRAFLAELVGKPPESLVYLDESGIDNACDYAYGWCKRGQRFHAAVFCGGIIPPQTNLLKLGHHTQRVSMIAALRNQKLIAPFTNERYCNRKVFETWLEQSKSAIAATWTNTHPRQCLVSQVPANSSVN